MFAIEINKFINNTFVEVLVVWCKQNWVLASDQISMKDWIIQYLTFFE